MGSYIIYIVKNPKYVPMILPINKKYVRRPLARLLLTYLYNSLRYILFNAISSPHRG